MPIARYSNRPATAGLLAALAALAIAFPANADDAGRAAVDRERADLQHSLETSCSRFAGTDDRRWADDARWAEADACRRTWFQAHEEAVWRLQLNPHGPASAGPSS